MRALFSTATLTAETVQTAWRDPAMLAGYLELHIEQGPRLEHAGVPSASSAPSSAGAPSR
ncbi:MAG: hypothetical protein R3A10_22055 [Caldilineaceae bacterium]